MTAQLGSRGTGQAGRPTWWASLVVRTAALPLPSEHRWRYRQEFLAELYGMTRRRQTAHALQIVVSAWSLRSATSHPHREGKTMLTILRSKPLLCRLNIRHHWEEQSSPDGERYQRCSKCGKDRMDYPWGTHPEGGGTNTIGM